MFLPETEFHIGREKEGEREGGREGDRERGEGGDDSRIQVKDYKRWVYTD